MKTSIEGVELIKRFESFRAKAYKCPAGVWTYGFGHTKGVKEGDMITESEAQKLLIEELKEYEQAVLKLVKVELNQYQFDALVSFVYNLGESNLKKSTLLKELNKNNYIGASEQFTAWVFAGGKKLNGLVKRREAEKELFLKEKKTMNPIVKKLEAQGLEITEDAVKQVIQASFEAGREYIAGTETKMDDMFTPALNIAEGKLLELADKIDGEVG